MTDSQTQNNAMFGEGTRRERGKDAQKINILVAKAVANAVKSTLGPRGMDKMLVDELGDVTISNDGATILKEMSIEHPIGKMFVELAKTQDDEVGDGTTSSVIIAGELVSKAENLLDENIHSSIIIRGYKMASEKAISFYQEISEDISLSDKDLLLNIAKTSMTGKASDYSDYLSKAVVDSILMILNETNYKEIDRDKIRLEKKIGSSISETKIIDGIVLDKEIVHPEMPKSLENCKVAILNTALEIREPENDTKIQINSPEQLQMFIEQEESQLRKMVDKLIETKTNIVFCQKGIDDLAEHYLSKAGISAIKRVKQSDIEILAKSSGAKIITRINDMSQEDLGFFGKVYEKRISGENMLFIENPKQKGIVTILLRGSSEQVLSETERTITDAIGAVLSSLRSGKYVSGGGSCEIEVSLRLKNYAKTIGGREQLAIEAFADVLESIPKILAESSGLDAIDTLVSLRSIHQDINNKSYGVDVINSKIEDMKKLHVIEPLNLKTQIINSSFEVVEMILRIDDIIAASSKNKGQGFQGMPNNLM
ncbi:thermosome subunit [archaeon]|nr:thermosome subunit [archaeon]NCP79506.1 thermosome subunit [archaeon]NCP97449.1 thermosome subunit [archaeon]NCQ07273.1 thermosome subunit [archaeon]NCQ51069.1 thermosome subunit [archaeon]